jgi:thiopeptide-type bacteriocin biosynthesis protein
MSTASWISYHFFPKEKPDQFLAESLHPFLTEYIWYNNGKRAFFIRYGDQTGPHIRLRFKGEPEWISNDLKPEFEKYFSKKGTWTEVPYEQEPEKFGGAEALALCEEHFHISSRVVLDRLSRDNYEYGDALFDALKLHTAAAFAAGLSREAAAIYFDRTCNNWTASFFSPTDDNTTTDALITAVREDFATTLEPQRTFMRDAILQYRVSLEEGQYDPKQPEWLRWLRGNEMIFKDLGGNLDKTLPHLLHLTNNRLGINNHDEAYLMYVLGART